MGARVNKIMLAAIQDTRVIENFNEQLPTPPQIPANLAQVVMSALRGPDSDNDEEKSHYTAPIRKWVYPTREEYTTHGFVPRFDRVVYSIKDLKEADNYPFGHYGSHIIRAVRAIERLEKWYADTHRD